MSHNQIAHKVLADRIGRRQPGSKPSAGDRIAYVHIHNPKRGALQGEKIETPEFVRQNGSRIDYGFYITNQIMKPVQQLFALVLEQIPQFNKKLLRVKRLKSAIEEINDVHDEATAERKTTALRNKEIEKLFGGQGGY